MTPPEEPGLPPREGREPAGTDAADAPRVVRAPGGDRDVALAELVTRVLERGVVITGEVVISVGGVDLVYLGLDVLLAATDRLEGRGPAADGDGGADPERGADAPPGDDG